MKWPFRRENLRVGSPIFDRGASFKIDRFLKKSNDFKWYIRQFLEKVMISLHTFENSAFGVSEIGTSIEDQKWSDCFVEKIHGSDCKSWESVGFQWKVVILHDTFVNFLKKWRFRCRHLKIHLLGPQNSTPLSRIRNGVAVLSRELEGPIADPR